MLVITMLGAGVAPAQVPGAFDSGPAVLARGDAPAAMNEPRVAFRPLLEILGLYDTGLANVSVARDGNLANEGSAGVSATWGISGLSRWRRTRLGLDYRGSIDHYAQRTDYDSTNQSILLGLSHRFARHMTLSLRENAGLYSRDFRAGSLTQSIPYDPAGSYVPRTDFFDNRTAYVTTQVDLTIQKTARLSLNFGGDGSVVKRRSSALHDVLGAGARGDVAYRLNRRMTIGAAYMFQHYDFTDVLGGSDMHSAVASYGVRLSRTTEFSAYGGVLRLESKFLQSRDVDPAIAALLGISQTTQIYHSISYMPNVLARISRRFPTGIAHASFGHTVIPGNGLFLTSSATTASAGYSYTGLRRWSFNSGVSYTTADAHANLSGHYGDATGTLSVSRSLGRSVHFIARYSARQYLSGDYANYRRLVNEARVGFGFTPGDVPLRLW